MNLVTGGTGLVGGWLARMLLEEGQEVATFSRARPGAHLMLAPFGSKWTHHQGTFERMSDVLGAVKACRPEILYHIGGMLSIPSEANPQASYGTNIAGIFHILEAARLFDVKTVCYASTNGTYGLDIDGLPVIDDRTLQRPFTIYGLGKVFGELLGRYYNRKYGISFRSIRLPAVVGPGAKVKHVSVYNTWAIEKSFYGEPFEIFVTPETVCPIIYFKDAARSFIDLSRAPAEAIRTINYNLAGSKPIPSAGQLRDTVMRFLPQAKLTFNPETLPMAFQKMHQGITWDDTPAMTEWGWKVKYNLEATVEDFVRELTEHGDWYK